MLWNVMRLWKQDRFRSRPDQKLGFVNEIMLWNVMRDPVDGFDDRFMAA
ncbi:hypothetical protein HanOQP8_Chr02g0054301 [Helianthus annuus]|nr:hypothetical protein HanOQP8_Chr02g0054301 [Helianthus annuus]